MIFGAPRQYVQRGVVFLFGNSLVQMKVGINVDKHGQICQFLCKHRMPDDADPPKLPNWKVGLVMLGFRLLDAGLAAWVLVAGFILLSEYIFARNMNSGDTLTFMSKLFSRTGFAWFGWIVALIEVPLFAWTIRSENRRHRIRERTISEDGDKARDMLKKQKQDELKLK